MPARFAATENAVEKGLENVTPAAGIKLIDSWIEAVQDVEVPGIKGLAKDLEGLKKQLEADEPDQAKIKALVAKLGEATTKSAAKAEKENVKPKLESLGDALAKAA